MATLKVHSFNSYDLSEEELLNGQILNQAQKMVLQNDLAETAELKLALQFDASQPTQYAQQEAVYTAQISLLKSLLERSDVAEVELRTIAIRNSQS